ncbi:hypothetical protein SAMN05216259_10355 [Actinacidiphila guanduensis]|jgi:hypothetical protein|uniref:Uncharacterized protein n=1 Tax=Actinacidiphila guanduensis TaxID=310781 RepID=A0A1G9Z8F1_9ACTN|nr:hypothetical protein SAMN05216259_10355 [Actinacidiphila guanduensis]
MCVEKRAAGTTALFADAFLVVMSLTHARYTAALPADSAAAGTPPAPRVALP